MHLVASSISYRRVLDLESVGFVRASGALFWMGKWGIIDGTDFASELRATPTQRSTRILSVFYPFGSAVRPFKIDV